MSDPVDALTKQAEKLDLTSGDHVERINKIKVALSRTLHSDVQGRLECFTAMRKLLSIEVNPPIAECIDAGFIPILVEGLSTEHQPQLQFEACWALTNIASGTSQQTRAVVNSGALPLFVQLLSSPSSDLQDQAVWALGNIAGDSTETRDLVLNAGAMPAVLRICSPVGQCRLTLLRNAVWTISNMCRGKPQPSWHYVSPSLELLKHTLLMPDEEVVTDTCWALSYLSDGDDHKITAVVNTGITGQLVQLLGHRSPNIKTPALRTIGNIVTGDDMLTSQAIRAGCLPALVQLLSNVKKGIRKEAAWAISNITAGNSEQIQSVLDANAFPKLVEQAKGDVLDVAKEALWAISNATSGGTPEQIRVMVETHDILSAYSSQINNVDPKIIQVILEGLENVLSVGEQMKKSGFKNKIMHPAMPQNPPEDSNPYSLLVEALGMLEVIENLQQHENAEIYDKVSNFLRRFFDVEELDAGAAPVVPGGIQPNVP